MSHVNTSTLTTAGTDATVAPAASVPTVPPVPGAQMFVCSQGANQGKKYWAVRAPNPNPRFVEWIDIPNYDARKEIQKLWEQVEELKKVLLKN